jgi:hypothetical protein
MDSKTVRYGRIGEVVVMIFPEENGAKHFISQIETQNLLKHTVGMEKMRLPIIANQLKPRMVA